MSRRREIGNVETTSVDRISKCPDSVLVHILSFLPLIDAVATEVLSKRWQFLWTFLPSLHFCSRYSDSYDSDDEDVVVERNNEFATIVDKTLFFSNCKLKKLGIGLFEYEPSCASKINSWTRFAVGKGVEELYLELHPASSNVDIDDELYELPQLLYDNSWFKSLHFSWCRVSPKGNVAWISLKKLSIGYLNLSNDVIERILSGSPVLEILELHHCEGFRRLAITNSCVKKLILRDILVNSDEIDRGLEIWAPYLLSLETSGLLGSSCRLVNVSALVDAVLKCDFLSSEEDWANYIERMQSIVGVLLASLTHVKNLTLGTLAIEALSIMEEKGLSSPMLNCKCLTLDTRINKYFLPGIASMLRSTPNLETLVMTLSLSTSGFGVKLVELFNYNEDQYWTSQKWTYKCLTLHLKRIIFAGNLMMWDSFCGDSNFFSFVQFLLRDARVLQKMVLGKPRDDHKEFFEVAQKLLNFPRSSPDAAVIFC